MITIQNQGKKMLRNCFILSICFVAAYASGELSILSNPKSITFKGVEPLQSHYVVDVLSASMGYAVTGDAQWSGLTINDPFNLPKNVIAVLVDGSSHISVGSNAKTYELQGSAGDESLNVFSAELEAMNVPVCDVNFNQFDEGVINYRYCFGESIVPVIPETKHLRSSLHIADKELLQSISLIDMAAEHMDTLKKTSNILVIRLSLESIAKAHGQKSDAMVEAQKLISAAIAKLNTAAQKFSNNDVLVVLIANKNDSNRSKREVVSGDNIAKDYNLAEYYSQDYPVIFNIILWFMVVFGLSLLAICYAIGSMDPGRDSIIYRMTSTRMKKDN